MTDTKPVAWHFKCDEYESVTLLKQHADAMGEFYKTTPVPLYHAATLTDAEREAIKLAISKRLDLDAIYTLRNLLERLK